MAHRRQVHHVATGQRDVGGHAGTFVGERVLGHLDDDLLAVSEQLVDRTLARRRRRLAGFQRFDVGQRRLDRVIFLVAHPSNVGDVEKGVAVESDIDERSLHPG